MVEAASSGVAFSCHPGSGREDQVFISANFGLGETVVGGSVDPDEYTVNVGFHALRQSLAVVKVGRKEMKSLPGPGDGTLLEESPEAAARQVLSEEDILLLTRLVRRVYCALGSAEQHQDVEWAFDGKEFYLLQSRPVTAIPRYTYPGLKGQPTIWTNANFRDSLPSVIPPLSWGNMADALDAVLKSVMNAAGYPVLPGVSRKRLYRGRGYFNVSVTQWESYDCFASPPESVNALLGGHHPAIELPEREPPSRSLARGRRNLAFIRKARQVGREVEAQFEQLSRMMDAALERDLTVLSDEGLLDFWSGVDRAYRERTDIHFALVGSAGCFALMNILLNRYFPGRGEALTNALRAGGETTTSADHGYRPPPSGKGSRPFSRSSVTGGSASGTSGFRGGGRIPRGPWMSCAATWTVCARRASRT
jgi:pyruvate,water dikinase